MRLVLFRLLLPLLHDAGLPGLVPGKGSAIPNQLPHLDGDLAILAPRPDGLLVPDEEPGHGLQHFLEQVSCRRHGRGSSDWHRPHAWSEEAIIKDLEQTFGSLRGPM